MSSRPAPRALHPLRTAVAAVAALVAAVAPPPAAAQATPRPMDGLRVGITLGGVGLMGVSVEWIGGGLRGVEATVGTFGFRDVSLSLVGRQYFGGAWLRPVVGAGVWYEKSFAEGREGSAFLLRAPIGFDWRAHGEQFVGIGVSVTRALVVHRSAENDPGDDEGSGHLVPIPELAWRWRP